MQRYTEVDGVRPIALEDDGKWKVGIGGFSPLSDPSMQTGASVRLHREGPMKLARTLWYPIEGEPTSRGLSGEAPAAC